MSTAVDSASRGAAVLVASDDLDDLRYCHRVLVMFRGAIVAHMQGEWDNKMLVAAMEGVQLSND